MLHASVQAQSQLKVSSISNSAPAETGRSAQIANMWMIPMGMILGAPVTVSDFLLRNLLPVTLGNIVGGALCMATAYSLCYGRLRGAQGA